MTTGAATASPSQLDEFAARAGALYSLPAVAVKVLALTENPRVDARALKECIEHDPALTVKLLRVVNSSLFGLSREVSDLNQALALLGVKPLKMLVLGFSLPEGLLAAAARDELAWFWRHTLSRAVAAREISEKVLGKPGDEVFLAGLLQDIGALVLLGELGQPYAEFLREVIAREDCLHGVQLTELGFDHTELSARLLSDWQMPAALVGAIAEPREMRRLAILNEPHADASRVLHMAELLAQVVADRRFAALPELLDACRMYCGMDRPRLLELIASLEDKVSQLADVLAVNLGEGEDFGSLLAEARSRLAALAQEAAVEPGDAPTDTTDLATRPALQDAVDRFIACSFAAEAPREPTLATAAPRRSAAANPSSAAATPAVRSTLTTDDRLAMQLTLAVGACRAQRESLSVIALLLDARPELTPQQRSATDRALLHIWQQHVGTLLIETDDPAVRLAILPERDRHEAVRTATDVLIDLRRVLEKFADAGRLPRCRAAAGVATVATPARNFTPMSLLETALRCAAAAQRGGGGGVKSLEIS